MKWVTLVLLVSACATTRTKGKLVEYPEEVVREVGRPRLFALFVGVDSFGDSTWKSLRFAHGDAVELAQALKGFDEAVVLASPEQLSRKGVIAELDRLLAKAQSKSDVVLVYFSTHGTLARPAGGDTTRYLVLADTDGRNVPATGLAIDEVLSKLEAARAVRRILILDACYSGDGKSQLSKSMQEELGRIKGSFWVEPIESVSEATVVLSASAWGETALEDDRLSHGVYTHFLLEALREGDQNRDGAVTATEAHDWARTRTYYFTGGRQRPTSRLQMTGVDPIVLAGKRRQQGLPLVRGLLPELTGIELWLDGRHKGSLPMTLAVEVGEHSVELRQPGVAKAVATAEISLAADEELNVQDILPLARVLDLSASGGVRAWTGAGGLMPQLQPSVAVRAELAHWPWSRAWSALMLEAGEGAATLSRLGLGFRAGSAEIGVAGGPQWAWSSWEFRVGLRLSAAVLWRRFLDQQLAPEFAVVPLGAAEISASWFAGSSWRPGIRLVAGGLPLPQDGRLTFAGILQAQATLSWYQRP
jgi:hypothetical protein